MNFADLAVLVLVLGLGARGLYRGFFREVFGFAAWAGGGVGAYTLGPGATPSFSAALGIPIAVAQMAAFTAIFLGIYIVCRILGGVLARLAKAIFLGPVDRAAGLVFGAAKGIAIAAVLAMIVTSRRGIPDATEQVQQSLLASRMVEEGWTLLAVLSDSFGTQIGAFEEQMRGQEHWLRRGPEAPTPAPKSAPKRAPARG